MPALQVKDCPAPVYERLRVVAAEENRSIAQQALTIIEEFLAARETGQKREEAASSSPGSPAVAQPARPRFSYAPAEDEGYYLARRRRTLERIDALPPLPVSASSPSAVELLALVREEEAR